MRDIPDSGPMKVSRHIGQCPSCNLMAAEHDRVGGSDNFRCPRCSKEHKGPVKQKIVTVPAT